MGLLSKLFGTDKIVETFGDVAKEGLGMVSTEGTRTKADILETDSARADDVSTNPHSDYFNAFVDGINRLQRPGCGLYLFGGCVGWWHFPDATKLDPIWFSFLTLYLTFLFGGRAILQDLPKGIAAAMRVWKK